MATQFEVVAGCVFTQLDEIKTSQKAGIDALAGKMDDNASALQSMVRFGAAELDQMLDECADAVTARFDQLEQRMLYDSVTLEAVVKRHMNKMTEDVDQLKSTVILMGVILWFNLFTLVVIALLYVFWMVGFIKARAPPAQKPVDPSDLEIIMRGMMYLVDFFLVSE